MKLSLAPEQEIDQDLTPWIFVNESAQTAVWISYLNTGIPKSPECPEGRPAPYPLKIFPHMWERHPRITSKPGRPCALPHRYYFIQTRDGSSVKGRELQMNEALEQFADKSLPTDVFKKEKGRL